MIVRGFEMKKCVDYVDKFSPTPGLAVAHHMMSLAIANDIELPRRRCSCCLPRLEASQATRTSSTRSCSRSTVVHCHQEICTKPWRILNLKDSTHSVSRSRCGYDLLATNTRRTSMCQLTAYRVGLCKGGTQLGLVV
jgi:hypothetical protein